MKRGHAIITGALGGLGTAMTEKLCEAGIPVIATDRRQEDFGPWRERLPAAFGIWSVFIRWMSPRKRPSMSWRQA